MKKTDIPQELTALNQWICWRYEKTPGKRKPAKVLYSPHLGVKASVSNSASWTSFKEASAYLNVYDGLGFVLTDTDPYCFIDLDTPSDETSCKNQIALVETLDSYSELSPGGQGLHVICKASIPSGRRRGDIEIYNTGRYMTMTGNSYKNLPIRYKQTIVSSIWDQLQGKSSVGSNGSVDIEQKFSDEEILKTASNADNSEKFCDLWLGNWEKYYRSQSEADFAIVDIIAYYTQNRSQIVRLFRASSLGQRDKAQRSKYVKDMVDKAFDHYIPPVDLDTLINNVKLGVAETKGSPPIVVSKAADPYIPKPIVKVEESKKEPTDILDTPYTVPTGLMGDIARFIYSASPLPVPEMSIAAAIAVMAGVCGQAYNVSGSGLNQYVLLLANTGTGKEAMALGISKLFKSIKMMVPCVDEFMGPAEIASGQALLHHLAETSSCFLSICGEFGIRLQQISSPRASHYEKQLKRVLLDLYSKSGKDATLGGGIYADASKNIGSVSSPSVSILGESVPQEFYNAIDESTITGGLMPRFTLIEYTGPRVSLRQDHELVLPDQSLVESFGGLVAGCLTLMKNDTVIQIEYPIEHFTKLSEFCKDQINNTTVGVIRQLWSRAHLKTLKLAALVAIGNNTAFPRVSHADAMWAQGIVKSDIMKVSQRFFDGEISNDMSYESVQIEKIEQLAVTFLTMPYEKCSNYGVSRAMYDDAIIPYGFFSKKLISTSPFKKDRIGATNAVKRALQSVVDNGDFADVSKVELMRNYEFRGRAYIVKNVALLTQVREKAAH